MKRVFAFLSVFILFLSLTPCADCSAEKPLDGQEMGSDSPLDNTHSDDFEDCSPFCCSCCQVTISQSVEYFEIAELNDADHQSEFFTVNPVSRARKIWQPPKA